MADKLSWITDELNTLQEQGLPVDRANPGISSCWGILAVEPFD